MLKLNLNKKISFLLGILLAFIFLYYFSYGNFEKKNFEELAIGEKAKATFGKVDNINIHCRDLRDIDQCLDDYKKFGSNLPIILWLGNSQLHVINQHSRGEETASVILHKLLKKKRILSDDIFTT